MNEPDLSVFDHIFKGELSRRTRDLVSWLSMFRTVVAPNEMGAVLFVIHATWEEFPVYAHAMDVTVRRQLKMNTPPFGHVLPNSGPLIADGLIDQDAYEDADIGTFERGSGLLSVWFSECWHEAGCNSIGLPAYIHLHDSDEYLELNRKEWLDGLRHLK